VRYLLVLKLDAGWLRACILEGELLEEYCRHAVIRGVYYHHDNLLYTTWL